MPQLDDILTAQSAWRQALAAGPESARQSAGEALDICRKALEVLCANLLDSGYEWAEVAALPAESLTANCRVLEQILGEPLPPVLVMFWEKIGGVSLVDLEGYRHVDFWEERQITSPSYFCDGLHIEAPTDAWTQYIARDFIDWEEYRLPDESQAYLLALAPDGFHKDNISGGSPYGISTGSSWNPAWRNFAWSGARRPLTAPPGEPDFLSYLRTTLLECAGFPGFHGVPAFDSLRTRLLRGVPVF